MLTSSTESSPAESLTIGVYYDFASSLCFMAHRIMQRLEDALSAQRIHLRWMPLDLTLLTDWRRGDRLEVERLEKVRRLSRELAVPLMPPGCWMDSRTALCVALELEGDERERLWRERVWSAVYEDGGSLDDASTLVPIARDLGIALPRPVDAGGVAGLEARTREAGEAGVFGVPTFMLDVWPVGGIQDDETMLDFLSRFAERRRQQPAEARPN